MPQPNSSGERRSSKASEMPLQRNAFFVGRESYLTSLRKHFIGDAPAGKHQVLFGLGGIGKSQIALEYAHRYEDQYSLTWWLPAEDPTALGLSYARLARAIGLNLPPEVNLDDVRHRVRRVLGQMTDWLLIFDNAVRPESIRNFLPIERSGHVLITSQAGDWGELAMPVPVRPMKRVESIEFLHKRVTADDPNAMAEKLAHTLGDLPLALEQAAAVMEESGIDYAAYMQRFERHWAELLQRGLHTPDHPDSLTMTLELSFRQIEEAEPASAALMYLASFLAAENISLAMLESGAPALPAPLSIAMARVERVLEPLTKYSLVERSGNAIALHRLVAALTRRRLTADEQTKWCAAAAGAVASYYNYNSEEPTTWASFAAGVPHALAAANHATQLGISSDIAAKLLGSSGRYLLKQGRLDEARAALQRAIDLTRQVYGDAHPFTSEAANNLGRVLARQGEATAAAPYFATSLAIDQATYGADDPRVATVANNYGMCLRDTNDLPAAEHHFRWALEVYEKHYGPMHAKLAPLLNNLGCLLRDTGRTEDAIATFARGLSIAEENYGEQHHVTANLLYNCGQLLRTGGEMESAEIHLRRALAIDEQIFGPEHPDVIRDLAALSRLLRERGNREESEQLARRATAARS